MSKIKGKVSTEILPQLIGVHENLLMSEDTYSILPIRAIGDDDLHHFLRVDENGKPKNKDIQLICESLKSIGEDDDDKISKAEYAWVRRNNSFFISARPNVESVPAGLYDIKSSMQHGLYLEKRSVILDELFQIPDQSVTEIVFDMEKFWNSKEKYEEYGITYKRGILMYGPPGTGKTSLINLLIAQIIKEYNGIVINMESIDSFIPMANNIRALEPDKPILAIIEDLDSFMSYNSTKQFLNLLDGNLQVDNIVYLATTNYLERLEDRIKNRPSRFDRRYEIGYPTKEAREFYLRKKLKPEDIENIDLHKWIADSEGFTFSHIRELIVSVIVMDGEYEKTIQQLRDMYSVNESKGKKPDGKMIMESISLDEAKEQVKRRESIVESENGSK